MNMIEMLRENPVIPGIKDHNGLQRALRSRSRMVFVLYGDILTISDIVEQIKIAGKYAFVNVDLLEGAPAKDLIIHFLKKYTRADGVMSSKAALLKTAKRVGFYTIHRLFIIDSFSFSSMEKQVGISQPDVLEILPGWPKLVTWTREKIDMPIISGGMICFVEDVQAALDAGAIAISSTNCDMWDAQLAGE
ncbi:MAG: glycerol-3-phosphate responsive antiterminator [Spirochaetota bacterium]